MPHHIENRSFVYSPAQLYELVADVERYPEFLPWCMAARIIDRGDGFFIAELVIRFKHITEKYTSKVSLIPPTESHPSAAIDVALVSGPFSQLENTWRFEPEGSGTQLIFSLNFHFKTRLLDSIIGIFYGKAVEKMVQAFSTRADALFGNPST